MNMDNVTVVVETENWKRYKINVDAVEVELIKNKSGVSKSLRIYFVGNTALSLISQLFNIPIKKVRVGRWVCWKDSKTQIEVVIFA
jgi:hypothetical protein